jgi:biopolymer transport protein TolQ
MSLWGFVAHASLFSKAVLLILVLLSVLSWTAILDRIRYFRRSKEAETAFEEGADQVRGLPDLVRLAEHHKGAPSARMLQQAVRRLLPHVPQGGPPSGRPLPPAAVWEGVLSTAERKTMAEADRHLSLLATVSSSSPFIGLMGTVWGVMVAFLRIGNQQGQAMLEVVGPGIAEALIATVVGLATALPATIAYNYFLASSRRLRERCESLKELVTALVREVGPA